MQVKHYISQNLVARISYMFTSLLVNILLSRYMGAASSGLLYYTIGNYAVIALIISFSFESGITYFLSHKGIPEAELLGFCFLWATAASLLATGLLYFFHSNYLFPNGYSNIHLSASYFAGTLLTTFFSAMFFAKREFSISFLVPTVTNIIFLFFFLIPSFTQHIANSRGPMIISFFASYFVNGLGLACIYFMRYSSLNKLQRPSRRTIQKLWNYSSLAFITNIAAFFAFRVDYWILKGFSPGLISIASLGNYIQVSRIVQIFLLLPTIVATVVFPATAAGEGLLPKTELNKIIQQVLLLSCLACLFVFIIGKWAFVFVFGNSFNEMYLCFVYSIPAILSIALVRIVSAYFAGANLVRFNLAGTIIALSLVTIFNFILVPIMGINGAALADSIGYLGYMMILLVFLKRHNINLK